MSNALRQVDISNPTEIIKFQADQTAYYMEQNKQLKSRVEQLTNSLTLAIKNNVRMSHANEQLTAELSRLSRLCETLGKSIVDQQYVYCEAISTIRSKHSCSTKR